MLLCNKYSTVYTIAIYQVFNVMPMYIVLLVQQDIIFGPLAMPSYQVLPAATSMLLSFIDDSVDDIF